MPDILELEWLTTLATKKLLPTEDVAEMDFAPVEGVAGHALVIKRFDRTKDGEKLHFEEFNQLLGRRSVDKYRGGYEDMAQFIYKTPGCIPAEAERLFRRILACLLTGNTDAHLKNFALFHQQGELHLTPSYDLLASSFYEQYSTLALSIRGAKNLVIGNLGPKHIAALCEGYNLSPRVLQLAVQDLGKNLERTLAAVRNAQVGNRALRDAFAALLEKRWNGIFESIGPYLSKRQSGNARRRGLPRKGLQP